MLTLLEYAISMASDESLQSASIMWWRATSSRFWEDSKRRDNMEVRIGSSAITAVVITVLGVSAVVLTFRVPPLVGFSPRIHTRCCKVVSIWCQALPRTEPWRQERLRMALMHCIFLAVNCRGEMVKINQIIKIIIFYSKIWNPKY